MWFLDTNACIMYFRGHAAIRERWRKHQARDIAIPLTVYAELLVGAEKSRQQMRSLHEIETLLESHEIVGITEETAGHYARIRAALEKRGESIGSNDLWIAAAALAHDATLVTNNTAEFSRVPELKIEDWSQA